jgi:hypothetical protein
MKKRIKYSYFVHMLEDEPEMVSNRKRKFGVEFKRIIISSLGAFPNFTI